MNNIFLTLLSLSVSGSILALLLLALKPFIKNRFSNTWQYYIWIIIIFRFLLPITAEVNFLGYTAQYIENSISVTAQTPGQFNPKSESEILIDGETWLQTLQKADAVAPTRQNIGKAIQDNIWLIWATGMLMMFFYKVISYNAFVRFVKIRAELVTDPVLLDIYRAELVSAKVKRKIPLKLNDRIGSPMLVGMIRPILVIPSLEASSDNLKYILRHELTHYRRGDILYKWLAQLTKCVHWFNPLVYMISKQIDQSCELSCDEVIVKCLDVTGRKGYGDALIASLKAQENYSAFVVTMTMSDNKERLKERLNAIMSFQRKSKLTIAVSAVVTCILIFGAMATGAYAASSTYAASGKDHVMADRVIPLDIQSLESGEYVQLGQYTVNAGDTIYFDITAEGKGNISAGFSATTDTSLSYFTQAEMQSGTAKTLKSTVYPKDTSQFPGTYYVWITNYEGKEPLRNITGNITISSGGKAPNFEADFPDISSGTMDDFIDSLMNDYQNDAANMEAVGYKTIQVNEPNNDNALIASDKTIFTDYFYFAYGPYYCGERTANVRISVTNEAEGDLFIGTSPNIEADRGVSNTFTTLPSYDGAMYIQKNVEGYYYVLIGANDFKNLKGTIEIPIYE